MLEPNCLSRGVFVLHFWVGCWKLQAASRYCFFIKNNVVSRAVVGDRVVFVPLVKNALKKFLKRKCSR